MSEKPDRITMLVAGASGDGKSFWVANLPKCLIYDTDIGGGLAYAESRIVRNGSERIEVGSYPEVLADLRQRDQAGTLGKWYTVAIDHVTALQQEANLRHNQKLERDYGRANEVATKEWRQIREFVRRKDFNLICTGHIKGKWEKEEQIGLQIDGAKNMEGDVSIVLHLRRKATGYPSMAVVQKWRRDPEDPRGLIPKTFDFSLDEFVKVNGTNALTRVREPVKLATPEQLEEINRILEIVKLDQVAVEKLWKKNGAESWAELPETIMAQAIARAKDLAKKATNGK